MGRPRLPPGSYGAISVAQVGPSRYKARARFRDDTGHAIQVARYGQTKGRARDRLRADLATMQATVAGTGIGPNTRVDALADQWLAGGKWSTGTAETYAYIVENQIKPQLGGFRVVELRPAAISRAIQRVIDTAGPGAAKTAKTALTGMCKLAMTHEAIQGNPVRDAISIPRPRKAGPRALTPDEADRLCDLLRTDERAVEVDLPDLVEFMLGTGARIGEVCAARESVYVESAATWEVNATLKRVKGRGLTIQERPKTAAGWRVLALPPFLEAMIGRRSGEVRFLGPQGVLFPSPRAHALRDPSNTARDLRETLTRLGFDWVHSHTFRKTVATRMDEAGCTARVIADQLGHAKPSMTQDVYLGRQVVSADAARILDR